MTTDHTDPEHSAATSDPASGSRDRYDGPNLDRPEEGFPDGGRYYRVTAYPALFPLWATGFVADDLIGLIAYPIVSVLVGLTALRLDKRWKVTVDRQDRPRFAYFHAVHVELFDTEEEAEQRRDEILHNWSSAPYATAPRLTRHDIKALRRTR